MYQTWDKLLFMHWPFEESQLRRHIPRELQIDTFHGTAWVGVTPFTMPEIRPAGLPAFPIIGKSHEINVRTYVHHEGIPGVWFFSLDAANPAAVLGARVGFSLPYYVARMSLEERDRTIRFASRRMHPGAPAASFEATWRRDDVLPQARPGSREFFLTERYCLYASRGDQLFRARIHHGPWPLCTVSLPSFSSTMIEAQGLPSPSTEPILHGQLAPLKVQIWKLEQV